METKRRPRLAGRPPYWVLAREESEGGRRGGAYRDVLTVDAGEGKVLPLFGSAEQAESFGELYGSSDRQGGWRATQAWAGELLSLLSASGSDVGPCAGVDAVAFDPPEGWNGDDIPGFSTLGRRCFMDRLLGRGDRWSRGR